MAPHRTSTSITTDISRAATHCLRIASSICNRNVVREAERAKALQSFLPASKAKFLSMLHATMQVWGEPCAHFPNVDLLTPDLQLFNIYAPKWHCRYDRHRDVEWLSLPPRCKCQSLVLQPCPRVCSPSSPHFIGACSRCHSAPFIRCFSSSQFPGREAVDRFHAPQPAFQSRCRGRRHGAREHGAKPCR